MGFVESDGSKATRRKDRVASLEKLLAEKQAVIDDLEGRLITQRRRQRRHAEERRAGPAHPDTMIGRTRGRDTDG